MLKNVSPGLIENVKELKIALNELTVYDLSVYSMSELYYKVAHKLNEVINELSRFEGVLSDEVIKQNEKLIYLLGEGLENEVIKEIDNLIEKDFFENLINKKIFNELYMELTQKASTSHVWNMANMGQDVKEAMTGGSVAVVGKNAILNDNIVVEQISVDKTDFINVDENCNLINKNKYIKDCYVDGTNGELKNYVGWYATDFIKVDPLKTYYYKNLYGGHYAFYDKFKNFISGKTTATAEDTLKSPFTVPSNAYYMRMTVLSLDSLENAYVSAKQNPYDFSYKIDNLRFTNNQTQELCDYVSNNIKISPSQTDFIKISKHGNYFSSVGLVANSYIRGQVNGECLNNAGTSSTDYLILNENTDYYWNGLYNGYCAFYDSNKHYISGLGLNSDTVYLQQPFTTPQGTKYARFTVANSTNLSDIWINTENRKPPTKNTYYFDINIDETKNNNPCNFKDDYYITTFNKIVCIGDSLTEGVFNSEGSVYTVDENYSYPTYLSKLTGVNVTNLGHGGITSKGWYNKYVNTDLSGYDCAIIQLGVNDVAKPEENVDEESTKQYLQLIINKLKNENKNIKIFVAGITKSRWYNNDNYLSRNEAIKEFTSNRENEDIYFIDLKQYSIVEDRPYSSGHLTALGYLQQAKEYKNYISYLMSKNIDNFINIQFIGSDYTPI